MSALPTSRLEPAPDVARARRLLIGLYLLTGLAVATWLSRLPSIRDALHLSTVELGSVLLVGSAGSLATVVVAGALTNRWGSRRTLMTAAVMFSVGNALVGLGPAMGSTPVLVVGIFVSSSSYALSNIPLNLESVIIEGRMGRTVVPQFHAAFSVGTVVGSLVGAGVSWLGIPVVMHFVGLSLVTLVWRAVTIPGAVLPCSSAPRRIDADEPAAARRGAGLRAAMVAWREPRTLLIGVIVLTSALSEGSANNWLSIAVVDGFAQTEAVGAVMFGVFVGSMTLARLLGTALIDRYGRVLVLVGSGISSLGGLLLFGLAPSLVLAAAGTAAWGLGAGLVVPIGMASVAGDRLRTAGRVAVLSTCATVASIAAPPLLGLAAEVMGTRHALLLIGGGFVASIALARNVRGGEPVPAAARVDDVPTAVPQDGAPAVVPQDDLPAAVRNGDDSAPLRCGAPAGDVLVAPRDRRARGVAVDRAGARTC